MGILGKLEDWFMKKKDDAATARARKVFGRSHKDIIYTIACPSCRNTKAFIYPDKLKCTKCGAKFKR